MQMKWRSAIPFDELLSPSFYFPLITFFQPHLLCCLHIRDYGREDRKNVGESRGEIGTIR
jgi:hypothetical protein